MQKWLKKIKLSSRTFRGYFGKKKTEIYLAYLSIFPIFSNIIKILFNTGF